ncbi:hypothetical protein ABMA27_010181 [Loxostege sticticalis]|uniref:BED-type domain-containing protein n=1 Tax=Loxostege sticticalis TaxID=481309 RepID=A0ABR3H4V0_LOXSC
MKKNKHFFLKFVSFNMERTAKVWKHFKKINESTAQCSLCPKQISCKGSNTTGLDRHLQRVHNISVNQPPPDESKSVVQPGTSCEPESKKIKRENQSEITRYVARKSLSEIISRLAAEDGLTIRAITKSKFIRESITQRGYKMPKNETEIMKIILNYYEEKKAEMIQKFKNLVASGTRFSLSVDEWTSVRNRRYFNLCLYVEDGEVFNLGLIYIPGKCGAEETKKMVEDTLKRFQLDFEKHIVATTSDGPNVMKKFGRESPSEMILCLNHAIHLGVVDTFYKKRQATSAVSSSEDTDDSDDEIMENKNSSDDEADDNASYDTNFRLQPIDEIKRVLDETRSLVKLFRKSPLKNIQLQNYVKAEFGKELSLLLDVKTRWNSIIVMAERFLKLKNCVKKALIDLNMLDKWNEDNLLLLQSIVDLLQPVKIAVEALGRQNATLLTAEAIIDVLLKKIQSTTTNDDLSSRFLGTLKARLEERRPQRVICLLKYLHTGHHTSQSQNTDFFTSNLSKTALIGFAEELYCRLFENIPHIPTPDMEIISAEPSTSSSQVHNEPDESFVNQMEQAIKKIKEIVPEVQKTTTRATLKKEFQLFEATGKRTENLELLYKALNSIKPTSVENERVFSLSGGVITKIRSRLSDKAVNALIFLKAYFIKSK